MHLKGPPSTLFRLFHRVLAGAARHHLFHELLNKRGGRFVLTVGPPIPPEALGGDPAETTRRLKDYVELALPADPGPAVRMTPVERDLHTSAETEALGAAVARALQPGDAVCLWGPLGAGKTTLARGLIRALTTPDEEIPSPTFTLVQPYEGRAFPIAHFDLYRLDRPQDAEELGLTRRWTTARRSSSGRSGSALACRPGDWI